jgi:hypothetical protein
LFLEPRLSSQPQHVAVKVPRFQLPCVNNLFPFRKGENAGGIYDYRSPVSAVHAERAPSLKRYLAMSQGTRTQRHYPGKALRIRSRPNWQIAIAWASIRVTFANSTPNESSGYAETSAPAAEQQYYSKAIIAILIAHIITRAAPSAIATFIVSSSSLVIALPLGDPVRRQMARGIKPLVNRKASFRMLTPYDMDRMTEQRAGAFLDRLEQAFRRF